MHPYTFLKKSNQQMNCTLPFIVTLFNGIVNMGDTELKAGGRALYCGQSHIANDSGLGCARFAKKIFSLISEIKRI